MRAVDGQRAVFRIPPYALGAVVMLGLCVTPIAFAASGLQLIYLVPVGLAWWLLRTRTEVDADGIRVRRMFSSRRLAWADVAGLRLRESAWVRAVRRDGDQVALPAVRVSDLPVLALVSGGRLADPIGGGEADSGRGDEE